MEVERSSSLAPVRALNLEVCRAKEAGLCPRMASKPKSDHERRVCTYVTMRFVNSETPPPPLNLRLDSSLV